MLQTPPPCPNYCPPTQTFQGGNAFHYCKLIRVALVLPVHATFPHKAKIQVPSAAPTLSISPHRRRLGISCFFLFISSLPVEVEHLLIPLSIYPFVLSEPFVCSAASCPAAIIQSWRASSGSAGVARCGLQYIIACCLLSIRQSPAQIGNTVRAGQSRR